MGKFHPITRYAALLSSALLLPACSHHGQATSDTAPAGALTVIADVSSSVAALHDPQYAARLAEQVGEDFSHLTLGDREQTVVAGSLSSANATKPEPIVTGPRLRVARAKPRVVESIRTLFARHYDEGDNSTNLLFTLENAHPSCGSGRDEVVLLTDGIEEGAYSVSSALIAGKPINLPAPPRPYLRGCKVAIYGLGVSGGKGISPQALPTRAMTALEEGWRAYFVAAGIKPTDVTFKSII